MRLLFGVILLSLMPVCLSAQDRLVKRDAPTDTEYDRKLKLTNTLGDSIYYIAYGKREVIAMSDVIAYSFNFKDPESIFVYPRKSDERIYGINKDGEVFFKADRKFSWQDPELAKECFLAPYRIYDSVFPANVKIERFICTKAIDEDVKIPPHNSFYIRFKSDTRNRQFKATLYYVTPDITQFIVKIHANHKDHICCFKQDDIAELSIESAGAAVGRVMLHLLSEGRAVQYSKERWLSKFDFNEWYFCK